MGLGERKQKDSKMASDMKERGEERQQARCPICHSLMTLQRLHGHIATGCRKGKETG